MARTRTVLATALGLSLMLASPSALAKGKKGKKKGRNAEIQLTGFKSFDKVFREVKDIDARISTAEGALKTAKRDLNVALDLKRGTPLKDALAELKVKGGDSLGVVLQGKQPKLTVSDAVPSNITNAVDAVNGLTSALVTSIDELAGVPAEIGSLQKQIQKFPDRAKAEFAGDPIGALFKAPKLVKSIKGNLEVTSSLPKRSVDVTERATGIVSLVSTEFNPAAGNGSRRGDGPAAGTGGGRTGGSGGATRGGARTGER